MPLAAIPSLSWPIAHASFSTPTLTNTQSLSVFSRPVDQSSESLSAPPTPCHRWRVRFPPPAAGDCTSRHTHGDLCSPLLLLSIIVANLVPQATPLVCLDLYISSLATHLVYGYPWTQAAHDCFHCAVGYVLSRPYYGARIPAGNRLYSSALLSL